MPSTRAHPKGASGVTAFRRILALSAVVAFTGPALVPDAARADPWAPMRADARIASGLTVIAVGGHMRDACADIDVRALRALRFVRGLVARGRALGFSRADIMAYIEDPDEIARYREIGRRYFAQNAADWDDAASVCRLARDEIDAGSAIGRLLRGG